MDRSECRILTIDDEKELTDIVTELLKRDHYAQVDIAGSCSEAKEKLQKQHYDLILLDVMLPDGNGFEFYAPMKETGCLYDAPVIFLSARDEDTARLNYQTVSSKGTAAENRCGTETNLSFGREGAVGASRANACLDGCRNGYAEWEGDCADGKGTGALSDSFSKPWKNRYNRRTV